MRVIAGRARGTKLRTLEGLDTRPTTDRVKEAMFSMIQMAIYDAECLDLFSGSGALGIELISRGAAHVTFVEQSRALEPILKENLKKTNSEAEATLLFKAAEAAISGFSKGQFDIVVMDPPYLKGHVSAVLNAIAEKDILSETALVVVEHAAEDLFLETLSQYFQYEKTKKYGKIGITLLRRRNEDCRLSGEL